MTNIKEFKRFKNSGKKIAMVTCYDFWSACLIHKSNIDAVLVGDSAAMVMHGFETTVNADIDMIVTHVKAAKKGLLNKLLIADLPFLEHRRNKNDLITSADKLMKAGAQAIKIEHIGHSFESIKYLVDSGIPIMGHIGLTPQSVHQLGGYKVQGREDNDANELLRFAEELQDAGCFAIVLELIPSKLSKKITEILNIPTIGIGAGVHTSGQILVLQDLLGLNDEFKPKFLRKYLDGSTLVTEGLNNYVKEVKEKLYPNKNESFY